MRAHQIILSASISLSLISCGGGGGGSDATAAPQSPEGLWEGQTSTGRTVDVAVLHDGEYWAVYSIPGNSAVIGGMAQGNWTASGNKITSGNLIDFNFEGAGNTAATVAGTIVQAQSLSLTTSYPSISQTVTSTLAYQSDSTAAPSLATIAGQYSGSVGSFLGAQSANITITSQGAISGAIASCTFSGQISPHSGSNAFDHAVTFTNGVTCLLSGIQASGIVFYNPSTQAIYVGFIDSARNDAELFVGQKH